MRDGHLNICKACVKSRTRSRYDEQTKDPSFIERERARGREKYKRLGYAKKKTVASIMKRQKYHGIRDARKMFGFESADNVELHHWNYNILNQVICLDKRLHKRVHALMRFSLDDGFYYIGDKPLDTLEKHLDIIKAVCDRDGFNYSKVKILTK